MKNEFAFLQKEFELYEKNEKWFNLNHKLFEKKYRKMFIAVTKPEKILVKENLDELVKELEKKKKINYAFITSIPPKGVASIL